MRNIRLFTKWLCSVMFVLSLISIQSSFGQVVNGKVTLKIEHRDMSIAEANEHIQNKTPILLTVSMILEGEWVTLLDNNTPLKLNACQFAYAVATTDGTTRTDAPFEHNPSVYMLSGVSCTASDGRPLGIEDVYGYSYPQYWANPSWHQQKCPTYTYALGFDQSTSITQPAYSQYKHRYLDENNQPYYEIDLFPIPFYLKDLKTAYIRGVDVDGTMATDPDDGETRDGTDQWGASPGVVQINLMNNSNVAFTKGDGTGGDWTFGSSACYGGVIPGGIFIEQVPVLTQFEPQNNNL